MARVLLGPRVGGRLRKRLHGLQIDAPYADHGLPHRSGEKLLAGRHAHVGKPAPPHVSLLKATHRLPPPHLEGLLRATQECAAVLGEEDPSHLPAVGRRTRHLLEALQIPQAEGAICSGAGHQKLRGMHGEGSDRRGMLREFVHQPGQHRDHEQASRRQWRTRSARLCRRGARAPAHREVPQLDHSVVSARDDPTAVRREDDLAHALRVALVRLDARLAPDVPDLEVRVHGARREKLAVGMPLHADAIGPVPGERARDLCMLEVPQLQRATGRAGDHRLLVRVKAHAFHGARVPGEALRAPPARTREVSMSRE